MDFLKFYKTAQEELVNAIVGMFAKGEPEYAKHLRYILTQIPEEKLMREPVFQSMFPYETDPYSTTQDLVSTGLLDQDFVDIMDSAKQYHERRPGLAQGTVDGMEFPKNREPYIHQVQAWTELLKNKKSIIVSTGTSSGKTECFTVPILQDLLREKKADPNVGVQAIFLYPLNALIASQRQRVDAWLKQLSDMQPNNSVRYAVYTGETDESAKGGDNSRRNAFPELIDRTSIRNNPPQLLFTNPTMMEYMMVRKADIKNINKNSKLKWIVIDEAHTFSGSGAAELALEIRRIIEFFGKKPDDIQFAITSATMGSAAQTKDFVAKLIGKDDPNDIVYIDGNRTVPSLDTTSLNTCINSLNAKYRLALTPSQIDAIRGNFKEDIKTPADICKSFGYGATSLDNQLKFINEISTKGIVQTANQIDSAILPLRAHFFARNINGLYACINPNCKRHSASHIDIGSLTTLEAAVCPDCGGQLLEVVKCPQCGKWSLQGERGTDTYSPAEKNVVSRQLWDYLESFDDDSTDDNTPALPKSSFLVARPISSAPNSKTHLSNYYFENTGNKLERTPATGYIEYTESARIDNDKLTCPYCGNNGDKMMALSFPASLVQRTFAQTLLNQSEKMTRKPSLVHDGQHYISFTDNRQGTANFDRQLNNAVEREWIRSRIYKELVNEKTAGNNAISWDYMETHNWVDDEDLKILASRFKDDTNTNFGDFCKDYLMSLVIDQLAVRPIYGNSLETMGLVRLKYPTIETLKDADVDAHFVHFYGYRDKAAALNDWKILLRVLIDITVRRNYHVIVPDAISVSKLLTQRFYSDPIYSKDAKGAINNEGKEVKTWPQFDPSRPNREGLLLLLAGNKITPNQNDIDEINFILQAAFNLLIDPRKGVLVDVNKSVNHYNGYKLDITSNKVQFELVPAVVTCPVSHQLLDCSFRGISPYIKGELDSQTKDRYTIKTAETAVPTAPSQKDAKYNTGGSFDRNLWETDIEQWFKNTYEPTISTIFGTSLDMQHSIFMDRPIFLTVEHSAQIKPKDLRESEKEFRDGQLNILSCSTTMEMGVDIGNLSVVTMNNIPPRPANYLQRIGRAGRRGETQSLALTVYDDSPIGKMVQLNPRWIMDDKGTMTSRATQPPVINLQSSTIVYRHIHSLVMGSYVATIGGVKVTEIAGPFVCTKWSPHRDTYEYEINGVSLYCKECETEDPQGPCINGLLDHIEDLRKNQTANVSFYSSLNSLVVGTPLEAVSTDDLLDETKSTIENISKELQNLLLNLDAEWQATTDSAQKRIGFRLKSYWSKSLITYLASKNFLPSANMPNSVVELHTKIKGTSGTDKKDYLSPSRELNIALYEYAPGQEVCIHDFLTKVQGIETSGILNGTSALQKFSTCEECGSVLLNSGISPMTSCSCGGKLRPLLKGVSGTTTLGITPLGFYGNEAYRSNKRTVNNTRFEPLLMNMQPWSSMASCYQIRSSEHNQSSILYINSGAGYGFAFCEYCGRMEPESCFAIPDARGNLPQLPAGFEHSTGHLCPTARATNPRYQPQRNVILTAEYMTDISEIQLNLGPIDKSDARKLLYSLGTILTRKYAAHLGINEDEIDFGIIRLDSLFIFDTHSGGASYSNQLPLDIEVILDECYKEIHHHINTTSCRKACTKCLIDRRSKKHLDFLDVSILYQWLQYEQTQRTTVPAPLTSVYGNSITKITSQVSNAILGNIRGQSPNDIHYFLTPSIEPDEIFAEIDHEMRQSKIAGKNVTLIVDAADTTPAPLVRSILERLSLDYQLETVTSGLHILPAELHPIVLIGDTLYCQYEVDDWNYYRIKDFSKLASIVRANYHLPAPIANSYCFINRLSNKQFNTSDYFSQILNGKLNDFMTFMGTIINKHVIAEYQDIYVSSPASAILACRVVKGFLASSGCSLDRFTINTSKVFQRPGTTINQDFDDATERDDYVNYECYPDILELDSNSTGILNTSGYLPHFRQMHIYNSEFDFYIIPDGGISNGWILKDGTNAFPPRTTPCTTDFTMSMKYGVSELIFVISWAKRIAPRSNVQAPAGTTLAPNGSSIGTASPLRRKIHLPAPTPQQNGTSLSITDKMKDILKKIDDIVSANGYEHFYPNGLPTILLSNDEPPLLSNNPQLNQWPNWVNDDRRRNQILPHIDGFKDADEELLLGVYNSHEEKVVLYEKGIQWFADVFMRNNPSAKENLFTIVLAHEIGHWITHKLHPQNSSEEWDTPVFDDCYAFDKSLLEGWAQLIAIWGIDGEKDLIDTFNHLLEHQSSPYHAFSSKKSSTQSNVMNTLSQLRSIRPYAKLNDWH